MILRQEPKNIGGLVMVDSDTSIKLHKNGFTPKFISPKGNYIFYVKTKELAKFMQDNNLQERIIVWSDFRNPSRKRTRFGWISRI